MPKCKYLKKHRYYDEYIKCSEESSEWNSDYCPTHLAYMSKSTPRCIHILQGGPRHGQQCDRHALLGNAECRIHLELDQRRLTEVKRPSVQHSKQHRTNMFLDRHRYEEAYD